MTRRPLAPWTVARLAPAALAVLLVQGCVSMAPQYDRPALPLSLIHI